MNVMGIETGYSPLSRQMRPHKVSGALSSRNVGGWERLLTAGIGYFILTKARKSTGLKAVLLGSLALSLFNRGVSGHCPLYGRMGLTSTI